MEVLVAQEEIAAGTTVEQAQTNGAFVTEAFPEGMIPETAVLSIDGLEGRSFDTTIAPGEPILTNHLTEVANTDLVGADKLAVTVELGDSAGVGGQIVPNSNVMLFVTLGDGSETRVLLPRVKVVDQEGALVTLEVTPTEAQALVHAQSLGTLYAALAGADVPASSIPATTTNNLFEGQP